MVHWTERRDDWRRKQRELTTPDEISRVNEWPLYQPMMYKMAARHALKYKMHVDDMMHEAIWVWHDCCRKYSPEKGPFKNYLSRSLVNQFHWAHERWNKHWNRTAWKHSFDEEAIQETTAAPDDRVGRTLARVADLLDSPHLPQEEKDKLLFLVEEHEGQATFKERLARASTIARKVARMALRLAQEMKEVTLDDIRAVMLPGISNRRQREELEAALKELRGICS